MNWIDAVILIVWGITVLWGFFAGLVQLAISLAAVIVSLALSSRVGDEVGNIFSGLTDREDYQTIGGFALIFLVLFVTGLVVSFLLGKVLRFIPLFGPVNRLGGMVAGIIVGSLLLSGVLTGVQKYPFDDIEEEIDASALGSFLADNFDEVIRGVKLIPGDWDNQLEKLVK